MVPGSIENCGYAWIRYNHIITCAYSVREQFAVYRDDFIPCRSRSSTST